MDTHGQAIKTYKALQERKKERERQADAVLFTNINRVQKARYRQYWSRGVK